MREALKAGILMFNVESPSELKLLDRIAQSTGIRAPIALRVNPDVDPETHPYISTGLKTSKFGIAISEALEHYETASKLAGIEVIGMHMHIGSQLVKTSPFADALARLVEKSGCGVRGTSISEDGGNVTVIGEKTGQPANTCPEGIAGNFERVISILRGHTNLRHLISGFPAKRLFGKLLQRSKEYRHTRGRPLSPRILDDLLKRHPT